MLVDGKQYRAIWRDPSTGRVKVIDQRILPHRFETMEVTNVDEFVVTIRDMVVRGAPLIGVTAAYGIAVAMKEDSSDASIAEASAKLKGARPTAVNLAWAVDRVARAMWRLTPSDRAVAAITLADSMADEDVETNAQIGRNGIAVIENIARSKPAGEPVRILTHCNAGWLATVDRGTATAPIYEAYERGIKIEVWVDETRPRNQGASLTCWELQHNKIPHRLIVDNAGGHLMQNGMVDVVIVGSDRTTAAGDVCNKIGTYLKALAAKDNGVPFYAAMPTSTIDQAITDGLAEIPIEQRDAEEVTHMPGQLASGEMVSVMICPNGTAASNPAFDVTPRRLVTGIITENGIWKP